MTNLNNIYIIGAGAIGKALAVFLNRAGKNVTLVRGSVNDGSASTEAITVEVRGNTFTENIPVVTLNALATLDGLIIICTKSFGNEALAATLQTKSVTSPIVLLQNGLGIETPFLHFPQLFRCVLFVTSQTTSGIVRFKPVAPCPVGLVQGDERLLKEITHIMSTADFSFIPEHQIKRNVWSKAIINTVFNSICPLLETDNGVFHREETALRLARGIIYTCVAIAERDGVQLEANEVEANLLRISKASDQQLISTLQDIQKGRQTEIDTLNFAIARVAGSNFADDVREVLLLGKLIKLKATLHHQVGAIS